MSAQTWPAVFAFQGGLYFPVKAVAEGHLPSLLPAAATEAGWDITAGHHEHLKSQIQNRNKQE